MWREHSSVVRFLGSPRDGRRQPHPSSVDTRVRSGAHEDLVRQLVAEQRIITLAELEPRLAKKKITVGKSSIYPVSASSETVLLKKVCGPPSRSTGRRAATKLAKAATEADPKRLFHR